MMDARPILTFDTSAINRLADDPDSHAVIGGLSSGFHLRFTFTSISEVIASNSPDRRRQLARLCRRLLLHGDYIDPQNVLLEKLVRSFEEHSTFDWASVDVTFPEAVEGISHEETLNDELARQEREESRDCEKQFVQIYDNAKPAFDRLFHGSTERPKTLGELVARLEIPGGAFWTLAANLYARVGKRPPDETTMRKFTDECDPFRALMIALCAAQYDRCVRPQHLTPSLRSGRNDTFMAVCLPYCHQFITNDPRQLACYREVISVADLQVTASSYEEFQNALFLRGETANTAT